MGITVLNIYVELVQWFFGPKSDHDEINKSRPQSCWSFMIFLYRDGGKIGLGKKKSKNAFFINFPSHRAVPQAQIEPGAQARAKIKGERVRVKKI